MRSRANRARSSVANASARNATPRNHCYALSVNPFRYGALALDEAFTNREDEIRELTRDILNGQDVVVLAPRRYGKTSLVWRVIQEVVKKKVLVAQVNLMTTPTKERLAEKLAATIFERSEERRVGNEWRARWSQKH